MKHIYITVSRHPWCHASPSTAVTNINICNIDNGSFLMKADSEHYRKHSEVVMETFIVKAIFLCTVIVTGKHVNTVC